MMNTLTIMVGRRGSGKTQVIKSLVKVSPLPKTLVVDTFDNDVWHNMKTFDDLAAESIPVRALQIEHIRAIRHGLFRIFGKNKLEILNEIAEYMRNALLIFDDGRKQFDYRKKLPESTVEFIIDSKQKNLNIIISFHSLKEVHSELLPYADYMVLFPTLEPNLSRNTQEKHHPHVLEAYERIKKQNSRFYYETIDLGA